MITLEKWQQAKEKTTTGGLLDIPYFDGQCKLITADFNKSKKALMKLIL